MQVEGEEGRSGDSVRMRLSPAQETLLRRASWAQACLWDRGSRGGYEFRYRYGIRAPGTPVVVLSPSPTQGSNQ